MSSEIELRYKGLIFEDATWRIANLTGWEGAPSIRVDDQARPNAHGSFDTPTWAGSRTVVAEGYCFNRAQRDVLLARLGEVAVPDGDEPASPLRVQFAGRTLYSLARITAYDPTLKNWGVGHFGWQVQWRCPDPLRYVPDLEIETSLPDNSNGMTFDLVSSNGITFLPASTAGQIALANPGSAPTWPTFIARGPLQGGFSVVEYSTGRRLRWSETVPAGSQVSINSHTGQVLVDGAAGFDGGLTLRQWWSVPKATAGVPGQRWVRFVAAGAPHPDARLFVRYAPAYW